MKKCIKISLYLALAATFLCAVEMVLRMGRSPRSRENTRTVPSEYSTPTSKQIYPGGRLRSRDQRLLWENIKSKEVLESSYNNGWPILKMSGTISTATDGAGRFPREKAPPCFFSAPA